MTRITLRLPDLLHRRLVEQSAKRGTSLNQEIVECLERSTERLAPVSESELWTIALRDLVEPTAPLPADAPDPETLDREFERIQEELAGKEIRASEMIIADREDRSLSTLAW